MYAYDAGMIPYLILIVLLPFVMLVSHAAIRQTDASTSAKADAVHQYLGYWHGVKGGPLAYPISFTNLLHVWYGGGLVSH